MGRSNALLPGWDEKERSCNDLLRAGTRGETRATGEDGGHRKGETGGDHGRGCPEWADRVT